MVICSLNDVVISIPQPVYLLIEDVGWWLGEDGSEKGEPFRNRFCRDHCLKDYEALVWLARRLSTRLGIAMVLGEWDRTDCLRNVEGATWMGALWDNSKNRTSRLNEAASYIHDNIQYLEPAVHGLCHEFWKDGVMFRSEFHDDNGIMRSEYTIRSHLNAFTHIFSQNFHVDPPDLFVPPALNHSFGNGPDSFQAILRDYDLQYVITQFSRARKYSAPVHEKITWEEGVILLERGEAPVKWDLSAATPPEYVSGPVVPLHWGNLLHADPNRNLEVLELWAERILSSMRKDKSIIAQNVTSCIRQAAAHYLAKITPKAGMVKIDLSEVPSYQSLSGVIFIRISDKKKGAWGCLHGTIIGEQREENGDLLLEILPDNQNGIIKLFPEEFNGTY